jgi:MYXO-CTERM domain-containing protein
MKKFQRRRLAVAVAASVGLVGVANAAFEEVTEANPFDAITSTGENPSLVMMDLDNDGDKDAVLFHNYQNDNYPYNYGGTSVWENIGSATAPEFSHVPDVSYAGPGYAGQDIAVSPFADDYDRYYGHPVSAADLEGDGDLDFFGGQDCAYSSAQLSFAEVESDESGVVTGVTHYPFTYSGGGYGSSANPFYGNVLAPSAAYAGCGSVSFAAGDLDNDSKIDIVSVDEDTLRVFMNTSMTVETTPYTFMDLGANSPLVEASALTAPYYGAPAVLHDVDADGDLDLVMGTVSAAPLHLFINEGTASTADFVEVEDTSGSLDVTSTGWAAPTFADMDGDGKDDLIVVELNMSEPELQPRQSERRISLEGSQSIRYFRNTSADDSVAAEESSSNGGSLGIAAVLMGMLFGLRRRRR